MSYFILGLVISMMLERLSWYVGEQNLKTELKEPSKMFADYAIGVLDLLLLSGRATRQ